MLDNGLIRLAVAVPKNTEKPHAGPELLSGGLGVTRGEAPPTPWGPVARYLSHVPQLLSSIAMAMLAAP